MGLTGILLQLKEKVRYDILIVTLLSITILYQLELSVENTIILALLVSAVLLWMTEFFPIAVTSFLVLVGLIVSGVFTADQAFAHFANSTVFFLLAAFIIGEILKEVKIGDSCVNKLLKASNENAEFLVLYLSLLSYFASFFLQVHIVVLLIAPLIQRIKGIVSEKNKQVLLPKRLYLSVIWMAIIGSTATFLGSARTLLAIDFYKNVTGNEISIFNWTMISLPISLVLAVLSYLLIKQLYPLNRERLHNLFLKFEASTSSNELSKAQKKAILIFISTVVAWILFTDQVGAAAIALFSVCVFFLSKIAEWNKIITKVKWDIIFLYGSAFCLGEAIVASNLADEITSTFNSAPKLISLESLSFISLISTEFINNAATVSILSSFAANYYDGLTFLPIVYTITLSAGIGIVTPMSSPAMAILYSESGLKLKDLIKPALIIKILSFIIINSYLIIIF